MKNPLLRFTLLVVIGLSGFMAACSVQIDRNADGSLAVETFMTGADLQAEIDSALADPLIQELSVNLHNGYATVLVVRDRIASNASDEMTFRLELGATGGHLTVEISETEINGFPLNPDWAAVWNERIAERLERAARRNPNSSLEQVVTDPDGLTMVWRVETARSSDS